MNEIGDRHNNYIMIMCDINNNEFEFKFKNPPTFVTGELCVSNSDFVPLIFRWTSKELSILDRRFNFTNIFNYNIHMKYLTDVHFWGLKGFDLNFLGEKSFDYGSHIGGIYISKCRLDFYHDKKRTSSCNDKFEERIDFHTKQKDANRFQDYNLSNSFSWSFH